MPRLHHVFAAAVLITTLGHVGAAAAHPNHGNQVRISQTGDVDIAAAAQNGDHNRLRIRQRGDDLSAEITQTGDGNRLHLVQFGEGESLTLTQTGGEYRTIVQGSPGNGDPRRVGMNRR